MYPSGLWQRYSFDLQASANVARWRNVLTAVPAVGRRVNAREGVCDGAASGGERGRARVCPEICTLIKSGLNISCRANRLVWGATFLYCQTQK